METTNFLPYAHQSIDASDIEAVTAALTQELITRGSQVEAFEHEMCQNVEASYAVAFSSGSAALYAAFQAAHVGPNDRLITSPNTFIASVAGGVRAGAKLRCVDIDAYGNLNLDLLSDEINVPHSRGRAVIIPVHFAGVAIDMQQLSALIRLPQTVVIEDAAHALGSFYPDGRPVGSCEYSDMTVFSFHPVKNITCGEGGMVTTSDAMLFQRLKKIRDSGIERTAITGRPSPEPWYYEVDELSCNFHMTEFQAALGRSQLRRLDTFFQQKAALIAAYRRKFASTPAVSLHPAEADARTHYHLFQVSIEFEALGLTRSKVMEGLRALSIGSQYHFVPLYRHPALKNALSQSAEDFPAMEEHVAHSLTLPLFSSMTEAESDRVVTALRKVLYQIH